MHGTDHTSDTFKFHVRKLVKLGYVIKLEDGRYELTAMGKEYANSLDEQIRAPEKQPKISILTIVSRATADGQTQYLLQQRLRNPFYGYWSEIHGRATWGEPFEETAGRQLKRQTGLKATLTMHGFRRIRDYDDSTLLEDKLFVILKATSVAGELSNTYAGGTNAWLTLDQLRTKEKVFATTLAILEEQDSSEFYQAQDLLYAPGDY
jgi:ADP-ribose pyrophosphatase YjhB (NUDIX family)